MSNIKSGKVAARKKAVSAEATALPSEAEWARVEDAAPKPSRRGSDPVDAVQPVPPKATKRSVAGSTTASPRKAAAPSRKAALPPRKAAAPSRKAAVPSRKAAVPPKAAAGAESAADATSVFQIYFEPSQLPLLDAAFTPLDNSGVADPLLEFAVLRELSQRPAVRKSRLWGAVSWKFREKTGMEGQGYLDQVKAHPGFDVYFCNPYPENEGLYASPWQQAFAKHPGFRLLAAQVLSASGQDPKVLNDVVPSVRFSSCNFFVGNAKFWDSYVPFVESFVNNAKQSLPPSVLDALNSRNADPHGLHPGASYWPFIIERLFTLYLVKHHGDIRAFKVKLPGPEAKLNVHVKRLREMKDVAHHTKSQWLSSCWLQYRNLFLLQAAGQEWCRLHLKDLTPSQLRFG